MSNVQQIPGAVQMDTLTVGGALTVGTTLTVAGTAIGAASAPYTISGAPPANANQAALQVGGGKFDGTAGAFSGNVNGTGLGINLPSGSTATPVDIQLNGSSIMSLNRFGQMTLGSVFCGTYFTSGLMQIGASGGQQGVVIPLASFAQSVNQGGLSIGAGTTAFDGTSAGHFVGSASGTIFAANAASGFVGNLVDAQVAGVNVFMVDSGGGVRPGNFGAAGALKLWTGTGVPSNANGVNGDLYFRSDGGAGTTIYQKRAGAWVATAA